MAIDPMSRLLREIGEALIHYADAVDEAPTSPTLLTWKARVERQRGILQEIVDLGGVVERKRWLAIAAKYGYEGRGVSGFFRSGDSGLLMMTEDDRVAITDHGLERLHGEG